jgi:hypothetical protein
MLSTIQTKENTPITHFHKPDFEIKEEDEITRNLMKVNLNSADSGVVETYGDINIISELDITNEGKRQTISRIDFNNQTDNNSGIFLPNDKGSFAPSPEKLEMLEKFDKIHIRVEPRKQSNEF